MKPWFTLGIILLSTLALAQTAWLNPDLPAVTRAKMVVSRMTLEEKISQMQNNAAAIPRLGIPEYNWWSEALHGVARAGIATVFPQAIGLGATWDSDLILRVATVIGDEARAKHHEFTRNGQRDIYQGLSFWSPNINIFRDPRWGRGQETYGEDPFLTGRLGVAFVKGLQGDDPCYCKTIATPKHYAVHSGPEPERHGFDALAAERDLRETYLPAFEMCVREAGAQSIMCAYNRYEGEPCCSSTLLMTDILRGEWGFDGYIVSDCGAISDIYIGHKRAADAAEASARAVKAGCDLSCGSEYQALAEAVQKGMISEAEIDIAVERLFTARFRLGEFDPPERVPYARIPYSMNDRPEHDQLALEAARASLVLLKNAQNALPWPKTLKKIAVLGPNADNVELLLGNYNGTPSHPVTPLQGLREKLGPDGEVFFAPGCILAEGMPPLEKVPPAASRNPERKRRPAVQGEDLLKEALTAARAAEAVVLCLGISPRLEGEEMNVQVPGFFGGDRTTLDLPRPQQELMEKIAALGKPTALVLFNGSALAVNWADQKIPAILEAWYTGQRAGTAIAEALFGDYTPGGRLPVTFYRSADQLPPFTDYAMAGRTYRYFSGEPLYPFGHGLSYTTFSYSDLRVPEKIRAGENLFVEVTVKNSGARAGDEVVQLYLTDEQATVPVPIRALTGFRRLHLQPGESRRLSFILNPRQFSLIDSEGRRVVEPGWFTLSIGGKQPGFSGTADNPGTQVLQARMEVAGELVPVK
jgi:beta-glucosidase